MGLVSQFVWSFWLCATALSYTSGVKVQFYRHINYTGLIYEVGATEKCHNLPTNETVRSFITDTCLIQHQFSDCNSTNTWRRMPGNHSGISANNFHYISSFQFCKGEDESSQLDLEFTKHYDEYKPTSVPDVLARYTRVCNCINNPNYIQKLERWSINTNNNYVIAYYEPNCSEDTLGGIRFRSGHNDSASNILTLNLTDEFARSEYKLRSLSPDKNSTYFKSSCEPSTVLSNIIRKVDMQERSLLQAEMRLNVTQNDIQSSRLNDTVELEKLKNFRSGKFQAIENKIDDVEKSMDDKIEKLKVELEYISNKENN